MRGSGVTSKNGHYYGVDRRFDTQLHSHAASQERVSINYESLKLKGPVFFQKSVDNKIDLSPGPWNYSPVSRSTSEVYSFPYFINLGGKPKGC